MRMMATTELDAGMVLARPIYTSDGRVLLRKGVALTRGYIDRLMRMGYTFVYVDDGETYDIDVDDTIPLEVRQEVVGRVKNVYDRMADETSMRKVLQTGELGNEFVRIFNMLFHYLKDNGSFVLHMSAIYSSDAFLYTHCVNVGIYTSTIAIAHGYSDDRVRQLGVGAMLHDIGKLTISRAILDKPAALTAEERKEIEKHCWNGYEILSKQTEISSVSAHCALQHHERWDGTGYPRQLKGMDIHEVGRMTAVGDVYDALTSNRVYRGAILPHEALEFLYSETGKYFDQQFVNLFSKHVNIYPVGVPVDLSNGCHGVVSRANPERLSRPVVRVLVENGQKLSTPYELDLSTQLNVMITRCGISHPSSI